MPRCRILRTPCVVAMALLAACGDSPSTPTPVASVLVSAPANTLIAGTSLEVTAVPRDAQGNPLTGRSFTWATNDSTVATVSSAGVVTGVAAGPVAVMARTEGKVGQLDLTVLPVPVASVQIVAETNVLMPLQSSQLAAILRDAAGNVLGDRPVTWSSSDSTRVRVSATGLMTAVFAGTVTITATSQGVSGTFVVTVAVSTTAPVIATISPATLAAGSTITITGSGFDAIAANNAVLIRGTPAMVLNATPTQLVARVPCVSSGIVSVQVARFSALSEPVQRTLTVTARSLDPGQALVLDASESVCNEIEPNGTAGRYLVVVYSAATSPNALVDFRLEGNTPAGAAGAVPHITAAAPLRARRDVVRDAAWVHDSVHFAMLESERALYQELRSSAATLPGSLAGAALRTPLPQLGDMRSLFYNRGGCSDTTAIIRGKAIYVGERGIIWEDSANTLQSAGNVQLADAYQRLGTIFDRDQYRIVRDNFGDPLRRDPLTDNDGRIHMVFTQRLNGSGAAAYVTSCDQYPRSPQRPASNFGELFYGFVPTSATSNLNSTSAVDGWFTFMARTVVHEVKHIASHAARIANGAPSFEQSWLEEGTARHAEELWIRAELHRTGSKSNSGYGAAADNGIFCDFNPANAICNAHDPLRRPSYGMRRHFNEIRDKLMQPWDWSPYGTGLGQTGSVFYQTSWSLVRYVVDRFAASDAVFFSALNSSSTNGVTNLSAVAGAPIDRIIGLWGLALFADDYPGLSAPSADIQFPSWNLRDIYAGLNADPAWRGRWDTPYPIQPAQPDAGAFASEGILRGGAHAYFELVTTADARQLLNLQALDGGTPSTSVRIAMTRLQ
jgi:hypothetical protein